MIVDVICIRYRCHQKWCLATAVAGILSEHYKTSVDCWMLVLQTLLMRNSALAVLLLSHMDDIATSLSSSSMSQAQVIFFAVVDVLARCSEFPAALSQALIPSFQRSVALHFLNFTTWLVWIHHLVFKYVNGLWLHLLHIYVCCSTHRRTQQLKCLALHGFAVWKHNKIVHVDPELLLWWGPQLIAGSFSYRCDVRQINIEVSVLYVDALCAVWSVSPVLYYVHLQLWRLDLVWHQSWYTCVSQGLLSFS